MLSNPFFKRDTCSSNGSDAIQSTMLLIPLRKICKPKYSGWITCISVLPELRQQLLEPSPRNFVISYKHSLFAILPVCSDPFCVNCALDSLFLVWIEIQGWWKSIPGELLICAWHGVYFFVLNGQCSPHHIPWWGCWMNGQMFWKLNGLWGQWNLTNVFTESY